MSQHCEKNIIFSTSKYYFQTNHFLCKIVSGYQICKVKYQISCNFDDTSHNLNLFWKNPRKVWGKMECSIFPYLRFSLIKKKHTTFNRSTLIIARFKALTSKLQLIEIFFHPMFLKVKKILYFFTFAHIFFHIWLN